MFCHFRGLEICDLFILCKIRVPTVFEGLKNVGFFAIFEAL